MRHQNLVALCLSLALFPPPHAMAQAPDARPDLAANAALKYWTAFALLPALDKDQEKLLDEWNKVGSDYPYHYLGSPRTLCGIGRAWTDSIILFGALPLVL